jgi:hypothetical protein
MPASEASNPVDELGTLYITHIQKTSSDEYDLHVEVRFGSASFSCDEFEFSASLKRAFLVLSLEGSTIKFGSRLHDLCKAASITTTKTIETSTEANTRKSASAGGSLSTAATTFSSAGEARSENSTTEKETTTLTEETVAQRITPRGEDKWEFREPNNEPLDRLYLSSEQRLCTLVGKPKTNRRAVTARISVRASDLDLKIVTPSISQRLQPSKNKQKMLGVLLARTIGSHTLRPGEKYQGIITISECEQEYER